MRHFSFAFLLLFCFSAVCGQVADSLSVDDLLASGKKMERELRYAEALRVYQQCAERDTANLDAALSLADVASTLGLADVAERTYRRILLRDTANFYARYRLARLYASQENYRQAIAEYERLYVADTTSARPVLGKLIGDCYAQIDSTYLAAVYYNESFAENPQDAAVANSLAFTLLSLGGAHLTFLPTVFDRALQYHPDNKPLLRHKAIYFYMTKDYARADTVYSHLLALGDSSWMTLKYAGASRYLADKKLEAVPLLEKAYARDTSDVELVILLGGALGVTYDRPRAFRLFDEARRLMQPKPAWLRSLTVNEAETLWRNGQTDEACRLFYTAWLRDKQQSDYLFRMDRLYEEVRSFSDETSELLARSLFVKLLYLNDYLERGQDFRGFDFQVRFLQKQTDDAFFRGEKTLMLIAPDGERSEIPVEEVRKLISRLEERMAASEML